MERISRPAQRVGSRTTAGATILILSRLITRCVDLATLVILGRLLSPADFGLVAIAMSVIVILEAVMELPLSMALVTLPARTESHYDTVFTLQLARGVLLAAIALMLAWPLSRIYGDHRLTSLICALAVAPASRGLTSPRFVEYAANFNFLPNFVMEVIAKVLALVLSVGLAWSTASYWSIAVGTIVTPVSMLIVSYCYAPYLPAISVKEWRDFSVYLRWTTAGQLIMALNWQMDQLILGRFVNRFELGRFSMASNLASLPTQIFILQVANPLVVAFSSVREDANRLKAAYQKSMIGITAVGLPIMLGMSITAEPIIRIVLGEKWLAAVPMLRWLSLAMIPPLFVGPLSPLAVSLNRTGIFFRLLMTEFVIKLPLMFLGVIYYGITGVIAARVITATVMTVCAAFAVTELTTLSKKDQLLAPWRPVVSAIMMAMVTMPLGGLYQHVPDLTYLVLVFAGTVSLGAMTYASSMWLLWRLAGCPAGLEQDVVAFLMRYLRVGIAS
jgi:O-antigen/teichoic acid export membrane protein